MSTSTVTTPHSIFLAGRWVAYGGVKNPGLGREGLRYAIEDKVASLALQPDADRGITRP